MKYPAIALMFSLALGALSVRAEEFPSPWPLPNLEHADPNLFPDEKLCGAIWFDGTKELNPDGNHEFKASNPHLRSISFYGRHRKTTLLSVRAYDEQSRTWVDLTGWFQRKTQFEGVAGRIPSRQIVTLCVPDHVDVSTLRIGTEGSNGGSFDIRFGYSRR